jgi:hypothetical protein
LVAVVGYGLDALSLRSSFLSALAD